MPAQLTRKMRIYFWRIAETTSGNLCSCIFDISVLNPHNSICVQAHTKITSIIRHVHACSPALVEKRISWIPNIFAVFNSLKKYIYLYVREYSWYLYLEKNEINNGEHYDLSSKRYLITTLAGFLLSGLMYERCMYDAKMAISSHVEFAYV